MANPVTWTARILQVRESRRPGKVGYGAAISCERPSRIATVPIGYADGFHCAAGSTLAWRHIEGHPGPIARARIDGFNHAGCDRCSRTFGDTQVRLRSSSGMHRTPDDLARDWQTIPYEVLTGSRATLSPPYTRERCMINPLRPIGSAFSLSCDHRRLECFTVDGVSHCVRPPFYGRQLSTPDYRDRFLHAARRRSDGDFRRHGSRLQSYTGFARFSAEGAIANVVCFQSPENWPCARRA